MQRAEGAAVWSLHADIGAQCGHVNCGHEDEHGNCESTDLQHAHDRSFTFVLKTSPTSVLLKKAAGVASGSATPNKDMVGKVTLAQVEEIAKTKMPDTNTIKLESVVEMVKGTAKNMGITVEA
eukprot:353522-Chlamydomonas_euryale.AAC.4